MKNKTLLISTALVTLLTTGTFGTFSLDTKYIC